MRSTLAFIRQAQATAIFLIGLHWIAAVSLADDPAVIARWNYDARTLRGAALAADIGNWQGKASGPVRLAADPPRMELKQAHVVLGDLNAVGLPKAGVTIETWVRVDKPQAWCGFLSAIQDNGVYERGWMLGFKEDRFCFGLVSASTKRLTYLTDMQPLQLGVWSHVVGVYDGTTMRLYVDGTLASQSAAQQGDIAYPPRGVVALGAYVDDNETYRLEGALAATTLYDGPLTATAVKQRFEASRTRLKFAEPETSSIVGWPTYMHDDGRSGTTRESLKPPLKLRWTYHALHPPEPAWPPPAKQNFWAGQFDLPPRVTYDRAFHLVSDGERVYFGSSADDQVRALNLIDGKPLWSFFSEGPVRLAPSVAEGRVYFGSDDGRVYCVDAESGDEQWRFNAAERPRVIPGNGRLISTSPVRTGVIIHDGIARFGSGLFPAQGAYQFAVDAATGKELARGKLNFSPQGYLVRKGAVLQIPQGRAPTTTFAKLPAAARQPRKATPLRKKQYPYAWIRAGKHQAGGGDDEIALFADDRDEPVWKAAVAGKAHSLAVAGGCLLVSTDRGVLYCFAPDTPKETKRGDQATSAVEHTPTVEGFAWRDVAEQRGFENWAREALASVDAASGYCLVVGGDSRHAYALSKQTRLRVLALQNDAKSAEQMRRTLATAGVYGAVSVRVETSPQPPFASKLFNAVVIVEGGDAWSPKQLANLVRPNGGVLVDATLDTRIADTQDKNGSQRQRRAKQWRAQPANLLPLQLASADRSPQLLVFRRPSLEDVGEWSHLYGNPANTSCSNDKLVAGELQLQWFGRPGPRGMVDRHHRATAPLSVDGRLFVPGNEQIFGVDAYNGAVLWHVELPGFRRVGALRDAGNMTATADTLYAVAKDACYALSTDDGSVRATLRAPTGADGATRHWGLAATIDDLLYGSTTLPNASRSGHNREQINETYYDFVAIVTSDSLFAMDRRNGDPKWRYQARGAILNPTITFGDDRCYFLESRDPSTLDAGRQGRVKLATFFGKGSDLVALDRRTGKELWRRQPDFSKIQHHLYLAFAKGKLVAVGTRNQRSSSGVSLHYDLFAFDAASGKPLWSATQDQKRGPGGSHGEQDQHPAIVGDTILQEPYAYDLATGERRVDWRFVRGGHGCGAISASASAFFFRAGNPTMCDVNTGAKQKVNAVSRPGCWINMIPAGGLLLIPEASSGCTCNFAVQGSMAFAPKD